jgi:hypothetical protein
MRDGVCLSAWVYCAAAALWGTRARIASRPANASTRMTTTPSTMSCEPGGSCMIYINFTIRIKRTLAKKTPIAEAEPPKMSVPPITTTATDCSR